MYHAFGPLVPEQAVKLDMAGLLAHPSPDRLPARQGSGIRWHRGFGRTYSCGHSSGLAPDSLLYTISRCKYTKK